MTYKRLGDLLISVGLISEEQLAQALELQKTSKKRLGDVLTGSGMITPPLGRAWAPGIFGESVTTYPSLSKVLSPPVQFWECLFPSSLPLEDTPPASGSRGETSIALELTPAFCFAAMPF